MLYKNAKRVFGIKRQPAHVERVVWQAQRLEDKRQKPCISSNTLRKSFEAASKGLRNITLTSRHQHARNRRALLRAGRVAQTVRWQGVQSLAGYERWSEQEVACAMMLCQRGVGVPIGVVRGRASYSNTSCFRRTVTAVSPAKAVACSASQPFKFQAAKLCR